MEVLARDTAAMDLGDKPAEYLRLPSLAAYLVFAQDEPKAWVWVRGGTEFSPAPEVVSDDRVVRIPALAIVLPLAAIYGELDKS